MKYNIDQLIPEEGWYYIPDLDIDCYRTHLSRKLSEIGLTVQNYYNRYFLDKPDDYSPVCPQCGVSLPFIGIGHGGYHKFCSHDCRSKYVHAHPDEYPEFAESMKKLYESGGCVQQMYDNPDKYPHFKKSLDELYSKGGTFGLLNSGEVKSESYDKVTTPGTFENFEWHCNQSYSSFSNKVESDTLYFYLLTFESLVKIGVTDDISRRSGILERDAISESLLKIEYAVVESKLCLSIERDLKLLLFDKLHSYEGYCWTEIFDISSMDIINKFLNEKNIKLQSL